MSNYPYPKFDKEKDYINDNLAYREKIETKAIEDIEFQALLLSMSHEDVLWWFNTFAWTFNPRLDQPHLPFVTYPFQDDFILKVVECVEEGKDLFLEKSRDMGVSWMVLTVFVWGWLFRGWDLRVGSRIRDYVDKGGDMNSLFEKMRYILDRLPLWMLPTKFENKRGTQYNAFCRLVNPLEKNTIVGESTNPNFARGGRSKAILYDEFAFWNCADEAWTGGADTTNCRIVVSTVNGLGNRFADIAHDMDMDIERMKMHWRLHPFKDEQWYQKECERRTPQEVAQELDISYEASASGVVYESFHKVPIGNSMLFDYNHEQPLYIAWDFGHGGEDPTALIWLQHDLRTNTLRIVDNYSKGYMDINYFGTLISGQMDSKFEYDYEAIDLINRHQGWKAGIHVGDPYDGRQTTFVGNTTIVKELSKHGIQMNLYRGSNNTLDRIRVTTMFMSNMLVHDRCQGFIESIQNSRWPKRNRTSESTKSPTKPVHNSFSHYRTALEYLCDFLNGSQTKTEKKRFYKSKNHGYQDPYKKFL